MLRDWRQVDGRLELTFGAFAMSRIRCSSLFGVVFVGVLCVSGATFSLGGLTARSCMSMGTGKNKASCHRLNYCQELKKLEWVLHRFRSVLQSETTNHDIYLDDVSMDRARYVDAIR